MLINDCFLFLPSMLLCIPQSLLHASYVSLNKHGEGDTSCEGWGRQLKRLRVGREHEKSVRAVLFLGPFNLDLPSCLALSGPLSDGSVYSGRSTGLC